LAGTMPANVLLPVASRRIPAPCSSPRQQPQIDEYQSTPFLSRARGGPVSSRVMRIKWDELEPNTYETVVSNLLGQLLRDVERIDGSGGDNGLDVIYDDGDIRDIYQLKSYTGRMSEKNRWAKIKADLEKAKAHKPKRWFLVVPMNPTPGEKEWFKKLTRRFDFKSRWRGLNWLDARMVDHPELVRYAQGDTNAEVVALLQQFAEEATIESVVSCV